MAKKGKLKVIPSGPAIDSAAAPETPEKHKNPFSLMRTKHAGAIAPGHIIILGLYGAALLAAVSGAALMLSGSPGIGGTMMGFSVLLGGLAVGFGWAADHMPWMRRRTEDPRIADLRNWQALKVLAILLNLMILLAIIFMAMVLGGKAGFLGGIADDSAVRIGNLLMAAMAVITTATALQAFRNDIELDRHTPVAVIHITTAMLAFVAGSYGVLRGIGADNNVDASIAGLMAWTLLALDLFITRNIPNAYMLLVSTTEKYRGHEYFSRAKAVGMPLVIAFGLLLIAFVVLIVVESGAQQAVSAATADPFVFIVVIAALAAIGASAFVARRLARQEDKPELFKVDEDIEAARGKMILAVSVGLGVLGAAMAGLALAGGGGIIAESLWADMLAAAILLGLGPYGFYVSYEGRRIRRLEDRFPDFLRDIAASHKGGLTLHAAVAVAARGEYGALSPYVRRMADQMTWNIPFRDSLTWLAEQLHTPLVQRAVYLILEADRSGGSTADVLFAAARDAREIKKMETDRRIAMSLYTIVIYITFGVFLLVCAVLYNQFVPEILRASEAQAKISGQQAVPTSTSAGELSDYRAFYYIASMVQGVGGGFVAGIMSTGRALLGLQHAFTMTALSFVTFTFLLI